MVEYKRVNVVGTIIADIKTAVEALDDIVEEEDTAHSTGDKGVMLLAVRKDSATSLAGADGDYIPIIVDANGRLHTIMVPDNTTDTKITLDGEDVNIDDISKGTQTNDVKITLDGETPTVVQNTAASLKNEPAGNVAADAADSGNPIKVGGKAKNLDGTAPGTAVAEDDRTNIITDVYGRQFVETTHPNLWDVSADYAAAQTNTSVKAAPGAGLSLYITDILISNGATAGNITLLDGSGGTVKWEIYPAINGGCASNLKTPIKLTANTALCITSTTVTTHSITICGFIGP